MALETNNLRTVFTNTRTPDKRWIPKPEGGTAVGELATHVGAPLLPELCPVAWDESVSKWRVYTQPSDAPIVTLTRDAGAGDGGSFVLYVDGLGVALAWNADTADVLAAVNAVLADAGKPYVVTVANSGSGTDLGTNANVQTITFGEGAGAPTVTADTSGLTDGGLNEPTGIALATSNAGTALSGTNIVRGFVGDTGGRQTSATEEVQFIIFKAGSVHRDDINTAAVRTVCGGAPTEGELDTALRATSVRDDGYDIQALSNVH